MTFILVVSGLAIAFAITWLIGNIAGWLVVRHLSNRNGGPPEPWNWRVLTGPSRYYNWWWRQRLSSLVQED